MFNRLLVLALRTLMAKVLLQANPLPDLRILMLKFRPLVLDRKTLTGKALPQVNLLLDLRTLMVKALAVLRTPMVKALRPVSLVPLLPKIPMAKDPRQVFLVEANNIQALTINPAVSLAKGDLKVLMALRTLMAAAAAVLSSKVSLAAVIPRAREEAILVSNSLRRLSINETRRRAVLAIFFLSLG